MKRTPTLAGTLPAVPTPLTDDDAPDEVAVQDLAGRLVDAGVEGLVVLGTSGEGMALPAAARAEAVRAARRGAPERVLVVGCAGQTADAAVDAVQQAAEAGADAALVPPPFYYPLGSAALRRFYENVADAAPLPVLLYHIPQLTKNALTRADVEALSPQPRIVGIKDSHGLMGDHLELLRLQTDAFAVLQGLGSLLLSSYAVGGAGAITPIAALFPELELALRRALRAGDVTEAARQQRQIGRVAALLRSGGYSLVANLKAVAAMLDVGDGRVLPPDTSVDVTHRRWLRGELAEAGLLSS